MRARLILTAGLLAFATLFPVSAATVTLKDLSPQQLASLDASEQRLGAFDRALVALDARRARHEISRSDYRFQEHDLLAFIANEADFQNAILHKERTDPFLLSSEQSDKIAKGCEEAGVVAARVGFAVLQGLSR